MLAPSPVATDVPPLRPRELFEVLDRHDVRYVLIGMLAAALHGSPLATQDADVCPARDLENLDRLAAALRDLDARLETPDRPEGVSFPYDGKFLGQVEVWNLVTRFGHLDVTFRPSGTRGYDDLRREAVILDVGGGVRAPVASLLDVIRSKEAAGRQRDRQALPTLRELLARSHRPRGSNEKRIEPPEQVHESDQAEQPDPD